MCGCFIFKKKNVNQVVEDLDIESDLFATASDSDVRPGMSPVVIVGEQNNVSAINMLWGCPRPDKKLIINARSETVTEKQMFRYAIQRQRCVIPASAFYEWDSEKTKVTFCREDKHVIYLAGIYLNYESSKQFVILTTAANESMIKVHDRMPLMLEAKDVKNWLQNDKLADNYLKLQMPLLKSIYPCRQLTFSDI